MVTIENAMYQISHSVPLKILICSEMERLLRKEATKCRVVERLSGNAHLLFPRGETTLAVRAYYAQDLKAFQPTIVDSISRPIASHGLEAFRDAFKYPVVFFILPDPKMMMDYLSRRDSFLHLAQSIMNNYSTFFRYAIL